MQKPKWEVIRVILKSCESWFGQGEKTGFPAREKVPLRGIAAAHAGGVGNAILMAWMRASEISFRTARSSILFPSFVRT